MLIMSFKNIFELLVNTRILDFKLYTFLKKKAYHHSNLKCHYKAIHNILEIPKKFKESNKPENVYLLSTESKKRKIYLSQAIDILSKYIIKQFIPKKVYSYSKRLRKKFFSQNFYGLFKSWREKFLEHNKNGTVEVLGNFIGPRINKIYGVLDNGYNFFIEKTEIFHYRLRFQNLIFKKLTFFPGKIISVYPKISQIKFSSLIDNERFIFPSELLSHTSSNYLNFFKPLQIFEEKKNIFFCNTEDIMDFIKDKESQNWVIHFIDRNFFNFWFIVDKEKKKYFSFRIHIFFDKKHLKYIIKWKKNIFFGPQQFLSNLLNTFEKHFDIILKNKDFFICGSEQLMMYINTRKSEKQKYQEFFFTFVENTPFKYVFFIKKGREITKKGIFVYKSKTYLYGNEKFATIESLKNMLMK